MELLEGGILRSAQSILQANWEEVLREPPLTLASGRVLVVGLVIGAVVTYWVSSLWQVETPAMQKASLPVMVTLRAPKQRRNSEPILPAVSDDTGSPAASSTRNSSTNTAEDNQVEQLSDVPQSPPDTAERADAPTQLRQYLRAGQPLSREIIDSLQVKPQLNTSSSLGNLEPQPLFTQDTSTRVSGYIHHNLDGKCFVERFFVDEAGQRGVRYPVSCDAREGAIARGLKQALRAQRGVGTSE